jgi:hypothetical protein
MSSGITPSLLDVISAVVQSALSNLHTCMPAEVVRVQIGEHKRQFVDVLPTLQRQAFNENGEAVNETLPIIPMVPVGYPQGGGMFISLPLTQGDIVLLVFAERSLDQWLQVARKHSGAAINPGDVGLHPLEGAIALPCGPAPRPDLLNDVDGSDLMIAFDGGTQLRVKSNGVV